MLRLVSRARCVASAVRPHGHPSAALAAVRPATFATQAGEEATTPADSERPLNPPHVEPISARYPGGVSITRRVLDVLRTGPKTRKQIFYAINKGAPRPVGAYEDKVALAAKQAARPAWDLRRNEQIIAPEPPHPYPTGILRNPTHLAVILKSLQRGKRLRARPRSSVERRMGEKERASLQQIIDSNPNSANLTAAAANRVRTSDGKVSEPWMFVLRDWSDPGFASKGAAKIAAHEAKVERQRLRREAKIAEANAAGVKLLLGRPIVESRRVRHKKAKAAEKRAYEARVEEATAAYRVAVMDQKSEGQPSKLGGDAEGVQASLDSIIARQVEAASAAGELSAEQRAEVELKVRQNAYRYMIHDSEDAWLIKLRSEQPKIRPETIKELKKKRTKILNKYMGADEQQAETQQ